MSDQTSSPAPPQAPQFSPAGRSAGVMAHGRRENDGVPAPRKQACRLPTGGLIERDRIFTFAFDGRSYEGYPGDTLASALLANGVHLVGRSFKYHRPRGILSAGSEEPNALVTVRRDSARETPNLPAT